MTNLETDVIFFRKVYFISVSGKFAEKWGWAGWGNKKMKPKQENPEAPSVPRRILEQNAF